MKGVLLPFLHNIRSAFVFAFSIDCTDFVCEGAPPQMVTRVTACGKKISCKYSVNSAYVTVDGGGEGAEHNSKPQVIKRSVYILFKHLSLPALEWPSMLILTS